ncbi:MAG: cytochrome c3 family protein, partial [Rubripirellula sp.]
CYYCHTNVQADSVTGDRWLHDEDVHLRAGFDCADCHRNGIDHQTVRGFDGEVHAAGASVASLSCQGCHVGSLNEKDAGKESSAFASPGRMGAPMPAHRGLPPMHFEKMTCTACHSGPAPTDTVGRQLNSIAHQLGKHVKRTGEEFPGIVGAVALPTLDASAGMNSKAAGRYTPHRMMWPSFWATLTEDKLTPLNPEVAYELVRKPLKVRREFTEELAEVKLSLSERKELIGEDRARMKPEDWTPEEAAKIAEAEGKAREVQVNERMAAALASIEEAYPNKTAIFISGGAGFVRDGESQIKELDADQIGTYAKPYAWPLAHNVRPARQSLGATGCTECHSENATFFNAAVQPVGLLPGQQTLAVKAHELQGADMERLKTWNQLFAGRSVFKILGLIALGLTCVLVLAAVSWNLGNFIRR